MTWPTGEQFWFRVDFNLEGGFISRQVRSAGVALVDDITCLPAADFGHQRPEHPVGVGQPAAGPLRSGHQAQLQGDAAGHHAAHAPVQVRPVPVCPLFFFSSFNLSRVCSGPIRGQHVVVEVTYETSSSASALQWLTPEQTAGKEQPYLFSQCQVSRLSARTQGSR